MARSLIVLLFASLVSTSHAGTTNSWRVFRPFYLSSATTGTNVVKNPDMETLGSGLPLIAWVGYGKGYSPATDAARTGIRSLQCSSTNAAEVHGASQTITLNQTAAKPIKLSGWSKALDVTGATDSDYSVYLDIYYTDNTPLYGQTIRFATGTHDWEYQERMVIPERPIGRIACYLLFRNTHAGTVWFDDITLAEIQESVTQFDGTAVVTGPPDPLPFNSSNRFPLLSGDGLNLDVSLDGGVIAGLSDGTNDLLATGAEYASGWFVCDRRAGSDWWNLGGAVTAASGGLVQQAVLPELNLAAEVRYVVTNNAIRVQATLSNLITSDRAVSLYFALPANMEAGYWWKTPRDRVSLAAATETASLVDVTWGARNQVSQYPLATVVSSGALTLAVPPDQYRPFRLAYNRVTRQFYAAFDVGISPLTTNFPQQVSVEIWLFRSDPAWGLRSGLAGLYARFPQTYGRTFTNEGTWVAFADLRGITNISDFNIAYHEIGYSPALIRSDDANQIPSFRYVAEPWSYWMGMPANVPNDNYDSVYGYLLTRHSQGTAAATATLSSGIRDSSGALEFFPAAEPWCPYGAAFCLNASPFISDTNYSVTKFSLQWNASVRAVYDHPENGRLDGEYIDSFLGYATTPDYSTGHMRGTSFPLLYTRDNLDLMTPLIFGTYEMARAIAADVHTMGKPIIANGVFTWPYLPIGQGLFDFTGAEINWFDSAGNLVPPADRTPLYVRALSGLRPYGYLLNTDFTKVSGDEMEAYMRLCAFYAIYPSAFSANASTSNYFEQPALYERDRALFRKYVPVVRALSLAGWQPVTDATTDTTDVGLERYGTSFPGTPSYLTLRNFSSKTVTPTVTLARGKWGASRGTLVLTNLFDGDYHEVDAGSTTNALTLSLQPFECRVYSVTAVPLRPRILVDPASFGFREGRFGFQVSALPGQPIVVEATTNLVNWEAVATNLAGSDGLSEFREPGVASGNRRFFRAGSR